MLDLAALKACVLCPKLCENRTQVVVPHGPSDARIMLLGQAPGFNEDQAGEGFIGKSGQDLRKLCALAGIDFDKCRKSNVVKCFPPKNRKPTKKEIRNCTSAWLFDEIIDMKPDMIIAIGDVALQVLCPGEKLSQVHGHVLRKTLKLTASDGSAVELKAKVVPMYHPAAAMYDAKLRPILYNDFEMLKRGGRKKDAAEVGWTLETIDDVVRPSASTYALDYETTEPEIAGKFAPYQALPRGLALARRDSKRGVVSAYRATTDVSEYKRILENPKVTKICHNAKFEYLVTRQCNMTLTNFHDTKLMAYVLGKASTELKDLTGEMLGVRQMRYDEWDKVSAEYPAGDAAYTWLLSEILAAELVKESLWDVYANIDLPVVPVLAEMERVGVAVDRDALASAKVGLEAVRQRISDMFPDYILSKDNDKRRLLYDDLKLPVLKRTKTGLPSVEKAVIAQLAETHEVPAKILNWNEADDLLTKYVYTLPSMIQDDGRVHGRYNQAGSYEDHGAKTEGTTTGRLSSSNPNVQNVPRRSELGKLIRRAFVPRPGYRFVKGDLSQEEPRIAAFLSGDVNMVEMFIRGENVYLPIAQALFDLTRLEGDKKRVTKSDKKYYDPAKTIWLGKLYGGAAPKFVEVAAQHGITISLVQAKQLNQQLNTLYPGISTFAVNQFKLLLEKGYVETFFGRRRYIPKVQGGTSQERSAAKREATNMPVQGTAGDILKMLLVRVHNGLQGHDARLVLTVHDEVVVEAAESEVVYVAELIRNCTSGLMPIDLPVEVSIINNWAEG